LKTLSASKGSVKERAQVARFGLDDKYVKVIPAKPQWLALGFGACLAFAFGRRAQLSPNEGIGWGRTKRVFSTG
jgi:hypothetical protein